MTKHKLHTGQNGRYLVQGIVTFAAAGATVEVPCEGLKYIESASAVPLAAYNANDALSINEAVASGRITVPATGSVTLTRNAGGTADLNAAVILIGW